jgi:hypothetical protein
LIDANGAVRARPLAPLADARAFAFAKRHLGGLDNQVKGMAAADVRFGRLELTQDPALALQISQAASSCARPLMASSLKQEKVEQEDAAPKTLHRRHTSSWATSSFIVGERNNGERTMALH